MEKRKPPLSGGGGGKTQRGYIGMARVPALYKGYPKAPV